MTRTVKYILRGVIALAIALILSLMGTGITLPVNIITISISVFMGIPGIVLCIMLCNFIF